MSDELLNLLDPNAGNQGSEPALTEEPKPNYVTEEAYNQALEQLGNTNKELERIKSAFGSAFGLEKEEAPQGNELQNLLLDDPAKFAEFVSKQAEEKTRQRIYSELEQKQLVASLMEKYPLIKDFPDEIALYEQKVLREAQAEGKELSAEEGVKLAVEAFSKKLQGVGAAFGGAPQAQASDALLAGLSINPVNSKAGTFANEQVAAERIKNMSHEEFLKFKAEVNKRLYG